LEDALTYQPDPLMGAPLKKGQILVTKTSIETDEKKPQYVTVGSGGATKDFPEDVVIDALAVFGALTKEQQEIVLFLRDRMVSDRTLAYRNKQTQANPNAVTLRKSELEEEDQRIRDKLRAHQNRKKLIEKNIIREIGNKNELMLNPFMFIPAYDFDKVRKIWDETAPTASSGAV
jgi:hypothetical protein